MPKPRFAPKQSVKRENPTVGTVSRTEEDFEEVASTPELKMSAKGQAPQLNSQNILSLQQTLGNQAVQRYINQARTAGQGQASAKTVSFNPAQYHSFVQRGITDWFKSNKYIAEIEGERVQVASKDEEKEATAIIKRIKEEYNITLGAQQPIEGIKQGYDKVSAKITNKLKQSKWKYKELVSLEKGLSVYAPILGANRATNKALTNDGKKPASPQELEFIGKLKNAIDKNHTGGSLDITTLGEHFAQTKSVALFSSGSNFKAKASKFLGMLDFPSIRENVEGTVIHEVAHAVFGEDGALPWKRDLQPRFWDKNGKKTGLKKAEQPVTSYGKKNYEEDMCETMLFYFKKKGELQTKAPQRFAFAQAAVKEKGIEE